MLQFGGKPLSSISPFQEFRSFKSSCGRVCSLLTVLRSTSLLFAPAIHIIITNWPLPLSAKISFNCCVTNTSSRTSRLTSSHCISSWLCQHALLWKMQHFIATGLSILILLKCPYLINSYHFGIIIPVYLICEKLV